MSIENRTFGIEIEANGPNTYFSNNSDLINSAFRAAELNGDVAVGSLYGSWNVKYDGSLNMDTGMEIVSPKLKGEEGFKQIFTVCEILRDKRVTVDQRCGFHVHVGVQDIPQDRRVELFKRVVHLYGIYEAEIFDKMMAPSRRGNANSYCRSVTAALNNNDFNQANTVRELRRAVDDNRYFKVNICSHHETIEFRQHQGTTNANKIIGWVKVLLKLVDVALNDVNSFVCVSEDSTVEEMPVRPSVQRTTRNNYAYYVIRELFQGNEVSNNTFNTRFGTNSWGSVGAIANRFNIPVETRQEGHQKFFKVKKVKKTNKTFNYNVDKSLKGLVKLLKLDATEASYITDRLETFNA